MTLGEQKSWEAGLFEGAARIRFRTYNDGTIRGCTISAKADRSELMERTFGGVATESAWVLPADEQLDLVRELQPFLRGEVWKKAAHIIVTYRLNQQAGLPTRLGEVTQ